MNFRLKVIILILLLTFSIKSGAQTINVAFIGNSYTGYNNLPNLVTQLALSGGDSVYTQRSVIGGYSLSQHLENPATIELIKQGIWQFVVLQEQSQRPTIPYYRDNFTYPAADSLNKLIQINNPCATTVFYMTWGRKYGGMQCIGPHCSPDFVDYFHMQDSLESAYLTMAFNSQAFCSPVGISWSNSIANGDPLELFTPDNSHPSLAGSYLAACTFYATIFNKSPVGLSYTGGLNTTDASYLQQVAAYTVLTNPLQWNIMHPEPVEAYFIYDLQGFHAQFWNESVTATEFLWNFGDTASGVHNTSVHINPVHEFSGPGTYIVTLEAGHPCFEGDVYQDTVVILEVGIINKQFEDIRIYPNPADEKICLESSGDQISYRLLDINGRIHLHGEVINAQQLIPTSALPAGIYLLEVIDQQSSFIQKIVIR
jgi:hypothetical protein